MENTEVRKLGEVLGSFANSDIARLGRVCKRRKRERCAMECKREGVKKSIFRTVETFLWCQTQKWWKKLIPSVSELL